MGEVGRVYRHLKDAILRCEFLPGDFLVEVDLARRYGTSRTPVREACNRLSQDGWIAQIRYKGYLVPAISGREILEIYEYRRVLECFTAERAAEIATDVQLAGLSETIKVESRPSPQPRNLVRANEAFHMAVAGVAGNRRVYDQLKLLLEHVRRLDTLGTKKEPGWVPHEEILEALRSHRPAKARATMAAHIDRSRDRMLKLFGGRL